MQIKWMIAIAFMVLLTVIDIKKKQIPVAILVIFGITAAFFLIRSEEIEGVSIAYSLIPGAFLLALSLCTRESIGYGDGWTVLVLGLLLGLWDCLASVFIGLILSALFSLIMLVLRKVNGKSRLPFLPFVTLGLGVVLVGEKFL